MTIKETKIVDFDSEESEENKEGVCEECGSEFEEELCPNCEPDELDADDDII